LTPRSYHAILDHRSDRLKEMLGEEAHAYHEYSGILASVREFFAGDRRSAETPAERRLRFESARDRLKSLIASSREVATFVEENVREINGKQGDPGSFRFLQRLLAEQNYKLAFWQNLNESINYRRFFTIADLVGVRVEDPIVFEATHGLVLRLVSKNPFAGLRVDHIDGLRVEAVPGVARVGVLINPVSPYTAGFLKERDSAARALGLELRTLEARDANTLLQLAAPSYYDSGDTTRGEGPTDYEALKAKLTQDFEKLTGLKLEVTVRDVDVKGQEARVDYYQVLRYAVRTPNGGERWKSVSDDARMKFVKTQGEWKIASGL